MEEKQLDFNQPLLSVRRFTSTGSSEANNKRKTDNPSARLPPLPFYKSDLKSGPLRNPGNIPFVWEQTPGRPKDESKPLTQPVERPHITPKLPPGRVSKVKQQDSDEVSKGNSVTQSRTGGSVSNSQHVTSLDHNKVVVKIETLEELMQEKEGSSSEDGDEAYLDARDTLSRTESFFMNCSVSGMSGMDDQDVQPFGNFSTDQQARDFMIGRFLPAAKAVASETPHHAPRKPPAAREQPRQENTVITRERCHPVNQYRPKALPNYAQHIGREESEDEDESYSVSDDYTGRVCGLLPRFCPLNPIPGLKMQDRLLSSLVHGMQAKSNVSQSKTGKEHSRIACHERKSVRTRTHLTGDKKDYLGVPEKSINGIDPHRRGFSKLSVSERAAEYESGSASPVVEKTLYIDSVHTDKSHSNSHSSEMTGQNNLETSTKDSEIHKNPSADPLIEDSKRMVRVDEKATLWPKSLESIDSPLLSCFDKSIKDVQTEITNPFEKNDPEKRGLMESGNQGSVLNQDLVVISNPKLAECKKTDSEYQELVLWRSPKFAGDAETDVKNQPPTTSMDEEHTHGLTQNPSKLARSKVVDNGKIDLDSQCLVKLSNQVKLSLALPSPKAPSDSWLKRTLPAISSRNTSSHSYLAAHSHSLSQTPNRGSPHQKWEKIVKSSNANHGHVQFSEKLLTPIPEA